MYSKTISCIRNLTDTKNFCLAQANDLYIVQIHFPVDLQGHKVIQETSYRLQSPYVLSKEPVPDRSKDMV